MTQPEPVREPRVWGPIPDDVLTVVDRHGMRWRRVLAMTLRPTTQRDWIADDEALLAEDSLVRHYAPITEVVE